ncbi:MAG: hypothetical protein IT193_02765 [Propionibacteriaceae bacterium]|nr:hypothetical protein [Propionibacteriaceae bacterium]
MTDDGLRERIKLVDPSASLPLLAADQASRLMEETMSTPAASTPPTGSRRVLLAAALVLAVAGVGWLFAGNILAGQPDVPRTPGAGPVVRLTAGTASAKCRAPEAATLAASADFAFAGTVKAVSGQDVTFTVTRVYRGAAASEVQVELDDGRSESLVGSGPARVGLGYLISAADGAVIGCGYSGEADSQGLRQLFEAAF